MSQPEYHAAPESPEKASDVRVAVDVVDYLLFPCFFLTYMAVLIVFDVVQRICWLFGRRAHQTAVYFLNWSGYLTLKILGVRVDVCGMPRLSPDKPYILASNHQSIHDIPILYVLFRNLRPRYVAKRELGRFLPSVSFNLRNGGSALIDRSNARQSVEEISTLGKRMTRETFSTVLFPEGTRARSGILKRFRYAGFGALLESCPEAEIVPIALDNSWRLATRKFGPIPRNITVHVRVGEPLRRSKEENVKALIDQTHASVSQLLEQIRTEAQQI